MGVSQSNIGWFDPQGRAEIQKEVVNLIKDHATLDASFNQGERRKELLPGRIDVKEGLCEGMSLHWIRRVLLGGKTTYQVDKQKGTVTRTDAVLLAKLKRQVTVGANVQVTEVRQQWTDSYLTNLGFTKKSASTWTIPSNLTGLWDETQAKGKYAKHWEQLSSEYDKQLNVNGRQSSRPFSNIVVISSTTRSQQTLGAFTTGLCLDTNFHAGTAALLSVGLRVGIGEAGGTISGHAIAAYCRSDREFFLFDPNIGVFSCATRDKLRSAIDGLIGKGWTTIMNWVLEGTYGYSLFQARPSVSSVEPQERPLMMTASPQSTAIENRNILPAVQPPVQPSPPQTPQSTQPPSRTTPSPVTTTPTVTTKGSGPGGGGIASGQFRPQGQPQSTTGSNPANPNQDLKRLLEDIRDKPERQISGAWGSHGSVAGGWVKVPYTLVQKIKAAQLTTTDVAKGYKNEWAIAKAHINQLIGMI